MIESETVSKAINYGLSVEGAPYVWWMDGPVPDRGPAWAENAPPPSPEEVIAEGCFCAGVPNLLLRAVGKEIPTLGDADFDGGCLAYGEYYSDVAEPFDESEAYPPGTLVGRYFSYARLADGDQGHVAVVLEGGYLLQSYDAGGGYPGVNTNDHLNEWPEGYFEYAVRPENWLDTDIVVEDDLGDEPQPPPQQDLVDDFIYYCQQLKGPAYRYTGGRDESGYEYCQQYGVDCSGMFDVVLRYMGLKDETPWGTVAIAEYLVGFDGTGGPEPYDPDKLYPKGTVIVNDNATDWGDPSTNASHVAMIVEGEPMVEGQPGQRIIHSRPPEGVADWETDYQTHYEWQSTWPGWIGYEWAGFLPELLPDSPPPPPPPPEEGISLEQLQAIMPNLDDATAQEYLPHLNAAMAEAEITTPLRQAAFLAQLAHESGELQWFEEFADGWAYEGREDLGNVYEGDGPLYKGRGPIQLTGRLNYTVAGEALGLDLVDDPDCVATPEVGFRTACWYWNRGSIYDDLNAYADIPDFDTITLAINGGLTNNEARWAYYNVACQVLGA